MFTFYPTTCPKLFGLFQPYFGKRFCVIQLPHLARAKVRVPAGVFQLKGPHPIFTILYGWILAGFGHFQMTSFPLLVCFKSHHLSPGLSLNTPDLRGVKRGINITFEVFFLQLPRWVVWKDRFGKRKFRKLWGFFRKGCPGLSATTRRNLTPEFQVAEL